MSKEERIKQIKDEILKYEYLVEEQFNIEQAVKLVLNSIYGSFGSVYFSFFNTDIAEAITLQAKEINQYAEKVINHYFANMWVNDTELHNKLGIKVIKPNVMQNTQNVAYMDTDSCYASFNLLIESTNYRETKYRDDLIQFILDFYEYRFKDYLQKAFDQFAKLRNTDNYQKFEMESIAESGIWLGKKKYFQDVVWEDPGTRHKSLKNIKSKGIEVIQSSTPTIIRKELKDILKFFLTADKIKMDELVEWLKNIKKKFVEEPNIENKCKNIRINNYEKYCINDYNKFEFAFKCPINVRAAIYYNYTINTNKLNDKYDYAVSGAKVKFYYCKDKKNEVFAFNPGSFPKEVAPEFDDDTMFFKVVITPINGILESLNMPLLDDKLQYKKPLF